MGEFTMCKRLYDEWMYQSINRETVEVGSITEMYTLALIDQIMEDHRRFVVHVLSKLNRLCVPVGINQSTCIIYIHVPCEQYLNVLLEVE